MITLADPLPGDLEAAHKLIRELLKTLAQQVHLNEKLQRLLRQRFGPKGERFDPAQLVLFAREILEQAKPAPTPAPEPAPTPAPSKLN
jgi:transposase